MINLTGSLGLKTLTIGPNQSKFFLGWFCRRKIPLKNDAALNVSFHDVLDGANRDGFCFKKSRGVCDNLKKIYIYIYSILYTLTRNTQHIFTRFTI